MVVRDQDGGHRFGKSGPKIPVFPLKRKQKILIVMKMEKKEEVHKFRSPFISLSRFQQSFGVYRFKMKIKLEDLVRLALKRLNVSYLTVSSRLVWCKHDGDKPWLPGWPTKFLFFCQKLIFLFSFFYFCHFYYFLLATSSFLPFFYDLFFLLSFECLKIFHLITFLTSFFFCREIFCGSSPRSDIGWRRSKQFQIVPKFWDYVFYDSTKRKR